ncbi:MAG: helix-turn-helix transcriptional regulator, partial [Chloroflexi bacterium]|nr:helix-turn-helix transcriptional regulator [Chloroflexota bacterium]
MPVFLLPTKLYIPPARPGAISRPRLTERLVAGVASPGTLTLLSGPAGFGKTTLLSEFAGKRAGAVAWVSLDEDDNDPVRFWSYLIAACQRVQPSVGETILGLFQSPQPLPAEAIPSLLAGDFCALERDLTLVLDD